MSIHGIHRVFLKLRLKNLEMKGQFFDFFCEKPESKSFRECQSLSTPRAHVTLWLRSIFSDLVHVLGLKKASKKAFL